MSNLPKMYCIFGVGLPPRTSCSPSRVIFSFETAESRTRLSQVRALCLQSEQQSWDVSTVGRKSVSLMVGKDLFLCDCFSSQNVLPPFSCNGPGVTEPQNSSSSFLGKLCSLLWNPFLLNMSGLLPQQWMQGLHLWTGASIWCIYLCTSLVTTDMEKTKLLCKLYISAFKGSQASHVSSPKTSRLGVKEPSPPYYNKRAGLRPPD